MKKSFWFLMFCLLSQPLSAQSNSRQIGPAVEAGNKVVSFLRSISDEAYALAVEPYDRLFLRESDELYHVADLAAVLSADVRNKVVRKLRSDVDTAMGGLLMLTDEFQELDEALDELYVTTESLLYKQAKVAEYKQKLIRELRILQGREGKYQCIAQSFSADEDADGYLGLGAQQYIAELQAVEKCERMTMDQCFVKACYRL